MSDHRDAARAALARAASWRPAEYVFWAAVAASWFLLPDDRFLLPNEIVIFGLFALSLDLVLGFGGIVSLGQAAFFGVGAYAATLLTTIGVGDPLLGLLAAGAVAAALGFATSFLVLRGSDLTRIMVTLSVAEIVRELANRMTWLTGGADGLQAGALSPLLGLFEFDLYGKTAYAYSLVVVFVLFVIARRVAFSPFGWSVRAVKGNALRTAAIGIPVTGRLVGIYTMAAAYAGVAGGLLAQSTGSVSLDVLAFHRSADLMLMLVIGGAGYLYGGLIGAALFKFMQDWLAAVTPQYWQFWIGALLILLVLVGRERILGWPALVLRRLRA